MQFIFKANDLLDFMLQKVNLSNTIIYIIKLCAYPYIVDDISCNIHLIRFYLYHVVLVVLLSDDDVALRHTLPVFTGLGRCPIVNWDFAGTVSIFGPDALPVVHQ